MARIKATTCTWSGGCGNPTTDPSTMCHIHRRMISRGSSTDTSFISGIPPKPNVDHQIIQLGPSVVSRRYLNIPEIPKDPVGYQKDAATNVMRELGELRGQILKRSRLMEPRCTVSSSVGSGKTIISEEIIKRIWEGSHGTPGEVSVVLAPAIRLVDQLDRSFHEDGVLGPNLSSITIHSDNKPKSGNSTKKEDDKADVDAIREFAARGSGPRVIFCTYASMHKIIQAQQKDERLKVNILVADEAHRLTGVFNKRKKEDDERSDTESDLPSSLDAGDTEVQNADEQPISSSLPRVFSNEVPGTLKADNRVFLTGTPDYREVLKRRKISISQVTEKNAIALMGKVAEQEDLGKRLNQNIYIDHSNQTLFGRTVFRMSAIKTVEAGRLVPPRLEARKVLLRQADGAEFRHPPEKDVTGKVSPMISYDGTVHSGAAPQRMRYFSYVAANSLIDSITRDGSSGNALLFVPFIKDAHDTQHHFQGLLGQRLNQLGHLSDEDATILLGSSNPDEVAHARMHFLHQGMISDEPYVRITHASSNSTQQDKDTAFSYFSRDCNCPQPRGGCVCANIVANVDLFGEGIDAPGIGTVVMANPYKTSDQQFTQAVGRGIRASDEHKKHGSIVIPIVQNSSGAILSSKSSIRSLYAYSRFTRDTIGVLGENAAKGEQPSQVSFPPETETTPYSTIHGDGAAGRPLSVISQYLKQHEAEIMARFLYIKMDSILSSSKAATLKAECDKWVQEENIQRSARGLSRVSENEKRQWRQEHRERRPEHYTQERLDQALEYARERVRDPRCTQPTLGYARAILKMFDADGVHRMSRESIINGDDGLYIIGSMMESHDVSSVPEELRDIGELEGFSSREVAAKDTKQRSRAEILNAAMNRLDANAQLQNASPANSHAPSIAQGTRVVHDRYGMGTVISLKTSPNGTLLYIDFGDGNPRAIKGSDSQLDTL